MLTNVASKKKLETTKQNLKAPIQDSLAWKKKLKKVPWVSSDKNLDRKTLLF